MKIEKLIPELIAQIAAGEDIANEDAAKLFRWLDKASPAWRAIAGTTENSDRDGDQ